MNFRNTKLPLKKVYYILFASFIIIPLLLVLFVALLVLNQRFKEQAVENIEKTQENIATELLLDVEALSLRLSHLVHTNNSEMLDYASLADTEDAYLRYEYSQKLQQSGNMALEPSGNLVSVSFYMKDGKQLCINNDVTIPEVEKEAWYQKALQDKNRVYIGSYNVKEQGDAYMGSRENSMLLILALAPDGTTDRNQKIEMVVIYYATDVMDSLVSNNKKYLSGKNNLGMMQIVDGEGNLLLSSNGELLREKRGQTCIRTPIEVNDATWYVENYVETSRLTAEFWRIAGVVLAVAILVLGFAWYFSRYLIKSIVSPIEEISAGLRQVEDGNLDIHIEARGQAEIRNMIYQFDAMVRRLRALIGDYEDRVRNAIVNPADFFAAMLRGEMTPEEVAGRTTAFFGDRYVFLGVWVEAKAQVEYGVEIMAEVLKCCERNPRFASRCTAYAESNKYMSVIYRVAEADYSDGVVRMLQELQQEVYKKTDAQLSVCISAPAEGTGDFYGAAASVKKYLCFRHLYGEHAIIDLQRDLQFIAGIERETQNYEEFARALYISDEKNVSEGKERIFATFLNREIRDVKITILAVILAIGNVFARDNIGLAEIFGQQSNYIEKLDRIPDVRGLKLWLTNYCAWILDYSAAKLQVSETDVIVRAKRYIAEHCEDAELSLAEVAEYVGLNEKYFTNRFTKETGETFTSYLTALRMQKAKELLKTTSFKIYEIAELVGYRNVEHFNRVFKKMNNVTPAQYRKTM